MEAALALHPSSVPHPHSSTAAVVTHPHPRPQSPVTGGMSDTRGEMRLMHRNKSKGFLGEGLTMSPQPVRHALRPSYFWFPPTAPRPSLLHRRRGRPFPIHTQDTHTTPSTASTPRKSNSCRVKPFMKMPSTSKPHSPCTYVRSNW